MRTNAWFMLVTVLLIWIQTNGAYGSPRQTSKEADVTLLYGDEFLLGVRVLGKSIRDTGSKKDMVVLVSDGVSDYASKLLEADGWIVEKISLLANPNKIRPKRLWGVYTKLKIFNMTNHKKVVYLYADTIVVQSVEDLFKCRKFCANLKHSERLNSGVMVVEPSQTVFNDVMGKVKTLSSYTGGYQGFLNSYYPGFASAHVFEPNLSPEKLKSKAVPEMERLSTLYNADVGLYMLANKWMVDESELRVIHCTLGPLKPWDWWTSWLLKPVDVWQVLPLTNFYVGVRVIHCTLGPLKPWDWWTSWLLKPVDVWQGEGSGLHDYGLVMWASLWFLVDLLLYMLLLDGLAGSMEYVVLLYMSYMPKVPVYLGGASVFVCFTAAVVALGLSLTIVPEQGLKKPGRAGSFAPHSESFAYDSGKGHQHHASSCDLATWYYGLGMAFLAVAAPSLPCLFGITSLFMGLGLMVVGGIILASIMTYASDHLAIRAFLRGIEDRDSYAK
ncbi:hypothetical protein FNV43_RR02809 [Rhamnella rubrinervis]|uniref:Hexosyltransferase n=1 Tax=Rhamnella rubrinervis TaxID=2594499 RepID=A0A8K0MN41_9ROSA|nr:hypothetical protein FNV43_RR02809 [Rhamnella rubrinervis]